MQKSNLDCSLSAINERPPFTYFINVDRELLRILLHNSYLTSNIELQHSIYAVPNHDQP